MILSNKYIQLMDGMLHLTFVVKLIQYFAGVAVAVDLDDDDDDAAR